MKRLLLFLFSIACSQFFSQAQELKPCGTSVLARRHMTDGDTTSRARHRKAPRRDAFLGEKRGLIILVSFPDISFQDESSIKVWNDIINREGYADNGAPGSVSDYFFDQSY